MKFQRLLRKLFNRLFSLAPRRLRHVIIRKYIHIPRRPPEGMIIKFAETDEEFNQAFELLQKCYAEIGIAEETVKIRTTKYHTLPTTNVVIALVKGEVVATLTHVLDSPLGLPIEDHWAMDNFRQKGELIGELSSLAVRKDWRRNYGLFLYLSRFALDYALHHLGVDTWVIVTHPNVRDFYGALFCFEPLSNEVKSCEYVKGAEGFAQRLDLNALKGNFERLYAGKTIAKNIHNFYFVHNFSTCFKPAKKQTVLTNFMTANYFTQLFGSVTKTLHQLDEQDKMVLFGIYAKAIPQLEGRARKGIRHRSPVSMVATLTADNLLYLVRVLNVSSGGVKVVCKEGIGYKKNLILTIRDKEYGTMQVPVQIAWTQNYKFNGLSISGSPPKNWLEWTEKLASEFATSLGESKDSA